MWLGGTDEDRGGAAVGTVGAVVVEPAGMVGDGRELALGALSEFGVGVGEVRERGEAGA